MKSLTVLGAIAVLLASLLSGCGGSDRRGGGTAASAEGAPYDLYTHCGIAWARIRGTYWHAERELNDGNGNPPQGWGNPFQAGRLTFQSHTMATFSSSAGEVIFHRTSRSRPPFICS
ncbi:hypothetical protein [Nocardioides sp. LS1]|uniref:hypothetical protein n=1 Tax=Nocardioides sp. LS1 TaxID=1027620 RepID=UPI000F61E236|nr:hypothetical protein [Nocardioides sp. LS1]